jgi:hypothetical protein
MRPSRICLLASVLLALGWLPAGHADPLFTVVVTTPITIFDGTGSGSVPLASDPGNALGDSENGYGFVNATAAISASPTKPSAGTTTVTFDAGTFGVHVSSVFSLNLDLSLVDVDDRPGRDFAANFGQLTPTKPLEISVEGDADVFALLNALLALDLTTATDAEVLAAIVGAATVTQTVTDAKYVLGVDVNLNGTPDEMILRTMDLDPAALTLDVTDGDLDALVDAITNGAITNPIEIEAGVSVSGVNLTFTGEVRDETTDPPFTLTFLDVSFGTAQATDLPEPSSLLLLLAAALSLLAAVDRARARLPATSGVGLSARAA